MKNVMSGNDRLRYLVNQYATQTASQQEEQELFDLIAEDQNDEQFKGIILELMSNETVADLDKERWEPVLQRILNENKASVYELQAGRKTIGWIRWAAAAVVIGVIATASYFLFFDIRPSTVNQSLASQKERFKNDVNPGTNLPQLVLADGRKVILDSAATGTLATQGNVAVRRTNTGEISYQLTANGQQPVSYNTLNNPRGSRAVSLTMADGSKVWLDAASSIKYPTAFVGKERAVEITGQAYFEVAHNTSKPFHVRKGDVDITVLGTHFNVNAFDDEEALKVTLLEGSVRVGNHAGSVQIKPGEQARLTLNSKPQTLNSVDLDQIMAWKNGIFKFQDTDIETLMKQLARWYDVDVAYEDKPTDRFVSTIPRDVPASQVFKILETTGRVHFKIDGKKITVMK